MATPRFKLAVLDWPNTATAADQEVTFFDQVRVSHTLADGCSIGFTMPAWSPAALLSSGFQTDVIVTRAGLPWLRGRMLALPQSWDENLNSVVSVTAVGYKRLANYRFLHAPVPSFTAVDQGDIVWGLIDHTQQQPAGDWGITQGVTATGVVRDRTEYKEGDNIGKRLDELGAVENGVWWDVDVDKVLTAKLWTGFPDRPDPLVLGTNISNLAREFPNQFGNQAGASGSDLQTVPAWASSPGLLTDPRGLWEVYDSSHGSVTEQATVTEYAEGLLEVSDPAPAAWKFTVPPDAYFGTTMVEPGEYTEVAVPASSVNEVNMPSLSVWCQITQVDITFDANGGVNVGVVAVEVEP